MTTGKRSWIAISATVLSVVFMASQRTSAQEAQALNLTLLKTSIQTQSDDLTINNNGVQAFPNITVTCPKTATKGCTLGIDVASTLSYTGTGQYPNTATVTVTGASLPPVYPYESVPLDGNYSTDWATFGFRWMQTAVPAGAKVTMNIQFSGTGAALYRTETVELFKN